MKKEEETRAMFVAAMTGQQPITDDVVSDILILHYKNKMRVESLSKIFSVEERDVRHIIATFAAQFSNPDNLLRVVDSMVKMKKRESKETSDDRMERLPSKDKEIAELRRQLKESEIKAEAYLEMIKVAEQVYRIPIRKKYGAK